MITIWTNHLSVGNKIIDSAHEDILNLINRVDRLLEARDGAALTETFELLENCLCVYFEVEEKIAQAINFDFTQHKITHQRLLDDFQRRKNILAAKNGIWSDVEGKAFTIYLAKSFVQHINSEGKPMKIVLDTHYYDFQPD